MQRKWYSLSLKLVLFLKLQSLLSIPLQHPEFCLN